MCFSKRINLACTKLKFYSERIEIELELALVLRSLSGGVQLDLSVSALPVSLWVDVHDVVDLVVLLHSTCRVDQQTLVEWFHLIKPIPVLSSDNVRVSISLSLPGGLVEELGISLESGGDGALSVALFKIIIELHLTHGHLGERVWLRSKVGLQVSLSESGRPLLVQGWMWGKHRSFTVASEEIWASFIEAPLIGHKAK
jgi:hypothetical protein